jgi:hypothetical protein
MKDMEAHLEKLRRDAAECAIISDLATDLRSASYLQSWRNKCPCSLRMSNAQ